MRRTCVVLALCLGLTLLLNLAIVGPYLLDDRRLDAIVRVVALDWRDFGEERARARLEVELDQRRVGSQVRDEDCTFGTDGPDRVVDCTWAVQVQVPLLRQTFPLSFRSRARIAEGGDMRAR